jgi:hypothetical protein
MDATTARAWHLMRRLRAIVADRLRVIEEFNKYAPAWPGKTTRIVLVDGQRRIPWPADVGAHLVVLARINKMLKRLDEGETLIETDLIAVRNVFENLFGPVDQL